MNVIMSSFLCYHDDMMTFGIAHLLRSTGAVPTGRDRLPAAVLITATVAALVMAWLSGYAIYRAGGADVLLTTALLAAAALAARVLHTATAARPRFAPAMHTAATILHARPAAVAGRWARIGLVVPTTAAVVPTVDGGLAVTLILRPGQRGADYATRAPQLAALLGVRSVDIFTGHAGRVCLALHP